MKLYELFEGRVKDLAYNRECDHRKNLNQTTYFRGTNNPDEESLIRNKQLRSSVNHLTNAPERGISVSDVDSVGKYFRYLYRLTGKEIGTGTDGEPLLDPTTVSFLGWIKSPLDVDQ